MQDFLEPISERSHLHHNEIKDIKLRNDFLMKKTEEMDRCMKVDLNLRGTLADLKKRIHTVVG